jgi:hypothetical protein
MEALADLRRDRRVLDRRTEASAEYHAVAAEVGGEL